MRIIQIYRCNYWKHGFNVHRNEELRFFTLCDRSMKNALFMSEFFYINWMEWNALILKRGANTFRAAWKFETRPFRWGRRRQSMCWLWNFQKPAQKRMASNQWFISIYTQLQGRLSCCRCIAWLCMLFLMAFALFWLPFFFTLLCNLNRNWKMAFCHNLILRLFLVAKEFTW